MTTLSRVMAVAASAVLLFPPARAEEPAAGRPSPASDGDAVQDVMFLSEDRPIFIRLRIDTGGKGFRSAWMDAIKAIYAYLDRNGDGTLTKDEADRGGLPAMVRGATGGEAALPRAELDTNPQDGKVSLEELADVLRPALGPFRVQVGRVAVERTDALFNHLDRNKDRTLTKEELGAAVASLRRFDLDDDELIDTNELEPFTNPLAMQRDEIMGLRGRIANIPPVIELARDDPSFRPVRMLLKRYDAGTGKGGAGDNRLSNNELKIDSKVFDAADTDADGTLDTEEMRRYLAQAEPDLELVVNLAAKDTSKALIEVAGEASKKLPAGVKVERLSDGDLEVSIGEVSLEFHADSGANAVENAKAFYASQFAAADADNNKYLEKKETKDRGQLASLFDLMDKDGNGKLYMEEVNEFVERETQAAQSQMVLSADDQGRAIFAIMDLNRDRHLGAREVRGTVARVSSWDRNGDGKVSSDEIPHHYQLSIGRGKVGGYGMANVAVRTPYETPSVENNAPGPEWFKRMDRNRDGDLSRREFFGSRTQFQALDTDGDGLINPDEAAKAKTKS
ncbi:MAG: hypothetical protein P4L84_21040 [Isosphaeraceae bacterium]|nr:hypothetical protein [Isosphaeraceae bacterium]